MTKKQAEAAATEILALDHDRADKLEEIATRHKCLPQVQPEIDALRHDDRLKHRMAQLTQKV